jgi:phage host-nuclease inhibitor protein Gam
MATTSRIKKQAAAYVTQTAEDCAADIRKLGDLQRDFLRETAAMNDAIAQITHQHQPAIDGLKDRINVLQQGVQGFCEAHRDQLTQNGKVKTASFVTGEVQWRQRPPSVAVRGGEVVIEALKRLGLGRFVRTKEEINKEAILNEPEEVRGVAGISINSGVEDFVITPFEAKVDQ